FRKVCDSCAGPVGEFNRDAECFWVLHVPVNVEQAGEEFMQRVPRNPAAVQVERFHANVSGGNFLKNLLAVWDSSDVAVAICALAGFELVDDVVHLIAKPN